MKLRQKLAMVLATAMVVTAVPVVTFAASTTTISKIHTTTNTDDAIGNTAPVLKIDLEDAFTGNEFYLQLEGSEWSEDATTPAVLDANGASVGTFERLNDTEAKITLNKQTKGDVKIQLSNAIVKADEAVVIVDSNNTEVTDAKLVFARKQEGDITIKAGELVSFYTGINSIADIEFEETLGGQIKSGTYEFELSLDTDDFEFVNGTVNVEGTRGLKNSDVKFTGKIKNAEDNRATLEVTVAIADGKTMSRGGFKVEDIKVEDAVKAPSLGELNVEVAGLNEAASDLVETTDVVVAQVSEYGASLVVTKEDDKLVEIGNGKQEEVTFELKETTQDSFTNREVEYVLENGFFDASNFKTNDTTTTMSIKVDDTTKDVAVDLIYKDSKEEKDTEIIGFSMRLNGDDATKETYEFEDVKVNAEMNAEGEMTLKIEGRGMAETLEAAIATINNEFKVETKAMNIEVGVKDQKGGKIVLAETGKETFKRGEEITIILPADRDLSYDVPEVSATGDMRVKLKDDEDLVEVKEDGKVTGYAATVVVERASKEAGQIIVENFVVSTDRAAADASYDVEIEFKDRTGKITVEDFFVVGEGIATTVTTTITNGATEMVVNGNKVALDAPAYIKNGKLMAPLRAVSEAFGIKASDIVYNAGEIMIFANGRTIQLTIGSNVAYVNGAKMTLANPAEIKSERTFVPVGDLGRLLGLDVKWDNATKTATFNN